MTINFEALELAVDLFELDLQEGRMPDFNVCLRRAIISQGEEKSPPPPLTADQKALADLMSEISERLFFTGWLSGLGYALWEHVAFKKEDKRITAEETQRLRALSDKTGGWIVWNDEHGETFVTFSEWEAMQAKLKQPTPTQEDEACIRDIANILRGEGFPVKHLEAIGRIVVLFNQCPEAEAEVFEFSQQLFAKYGIAITGKGGV